MADAIAKFWVMPRTGTALSPVDSTSAGVTATKGFNLAADLIGGLPRLRVQTDRASHRSGSQHPLLQCVEAPFRDAPSPGLSRAGCASRGDLGL